MARPKSIEPKYRLHKPTGQAVVTLEGRDRYLGKHGTKESRALYHRIVSEWQAGILTATSPTPEAATSTAGGLTIVELCAAYLDHAETYYKGSKELDNIVDVIATLKGLFGRLPAT